MTESDGRIPLMPGLAGLPAAQSRICFIDGANGQLLYRGYPIEELAGQSTYRPQPERGS